MNRKTLVIALTLATPALFVIGCGGMNETRGVAEEQPLDRPYMETMPTDDKGTRQPVEDVAEAVFAEVAVDQTALPVRPVEIPEEQQEIVPPAAEGPVQPEARVFYFATNDSRVKQEDYEQLIAHASYLLQNPGMSLRIYGHTDQSGSSEYNRWLAKQRAESVASILIEYGVQPTQIHIEGRGEDQPVSGLEHAIADRRVELEYDSETRLSEVSSF